MSEKDINKKMPMSQAIKYLKNIYTRRKNIEYFTEIFPEKSQESIIKALDESNNDIDSALIILVNSPESLEQNIKAGVTPNSSQKVDDSSEKVENLKVDSNSQNVIISKENENPQESYSDDEYDEIQYFEVPSSENQLKTERVDLHNLTQKEARFIVESSIIHSKENGIGVFHFVTGRGNHSVNNVPILRPLVFEICKKI